MSIEQLRKRTSENWRKSVELAKQGRSAREIRQELGVSRTYAYEAIKLAKVEMEEAGLKPLPSKIEVEEVRPEVPREAVEALPPTVPVPAVPAVEPEKPIEEIEIIPDVEDCQDLYALPFEIASAIAKDDALMLSEQRITKQGTRLHKIFLKYKWKLPLIEVMFLAGLATDVSTKVMYYREKRKEESEKHEAEGSPRPDSGGEPAGGAGRGYTSKARRS